MTKKLYYEDSTLTEFTARVLSCTQGKKYWEVTLDATAFYPEGGGQPYDLGVLGGQNVLEVHERGEEIVHYLDGPLEPDSTVSGKIDWARRFDLTQQHSGEHIVSGLLHAAYGCDNVGFHMGADVITIDLNCELTMEQLLEIEAQANQKVWEDTEAEIFWPTPEELAQLPYRSKKALTGPVRLVRFPGSDLCACCGTHVVRTGQIGLIKILSCVKFRSGVRVEMLCGGRALRHLSAMAEQNHQVSVLLSAKQAQTAGAVSRLLEEQAKLQAAYSAMEERQFAEQAAALAGSGDVLLFQAGLTADGVRRLAVAVMETCGGRAAVFSGEEGSYKYCLGQKDGDLRELTKAMNAALHGRGGGKPFFTQGSVSAARKEIEDFFAACGPDVLHN